MSDYIKHANGMYTWPTLYKKTSTGKEQQWEIAVIPAPYIGDVIAGVIRVEYGQVGGTIQRTTTTISVGKNVGKKNATTPVEQALAEAQAKWLKQHDKGYSPARGGGSLQYKPMLAHSYEDHKESVTFPAYIQPKLDGVRCIAIKQGGQITLLSRQGKEHVGLGHIRQELLQVMPEGAVWDGELYCHGMPFQTLVSLVKKDQEQSIRVKYCVYDTVRESAPFEERASDIEEVLDPEWNAGRSYQHVHRVVTFQIERHQEVEFYHEQFVSAGYEGAMLRVGKCTYRQGYRSRELLKVKAFQEGEFEIVDVVPGVGKMARQGIFLCKTKEGREFAVKCRGRDALREEYLAQKQRCIGKMLTVSYFSMTDSVPPVPRFPVGKCVRDYE